MSDPIVDTPFVAGLIVWLVFVGFAAFLIQRANHSKWIVFGVAAAVFVGPLWDLPFGLAMYHKYVRDLGGTRVFRTVEAEGYLDITKLTASFTSLGLPFFIPDLPESSTYAGTESNRQLGSYTYREVKIEETSQGGSFVTQPGYWEFRLEPRGNPDCASFEAWASEHKVRDNYHPLDQWCLVATRREKPRSRYQLDFSPFRPVALFGATTALPGPKWLPPVLATWARVVDRDTGEILAQSYALRYNSWFPMPVFDEYRPLSWHTKGSGPGFLDIKIVIRPTNSKPESPRVP